VTPPRHGAARPRDNWRGPRSGAAAVYARPSPEGRASGGGRLAGRHHLARPERTRRRRPSAAQVPSGRRPPALAGAMRPTAGGRATAGGAGRPDRKWQANDRQRAPAAPGGSLQRDGPKAESSHHAAGQPSASPFRPFAPSPYLLPALLNQGKSSGETEGIAFPRRGPGAGPRPPEARR